MPPSPGRSSLQRRTPCARPSTTLSSLKPRPLRAPAPGWVPYAAEAAFSDIASTGPERCSPSATSDFFAAFESERSHRSSSTDCATRAEAKIKQPAAYRTARTHTMIVSINAWGYGVKLRKRHHSFLRFYEPARMYFSVSLAGSSRIRIDSRFSGGMDTSRDRAHFSFLQGDVQRK